MQKYVVQKLTKVRNASTNFQAEHEYMQDAFMSNTNDPAEVTKLADAIWGKQNYEMFAIREVKGFYDYA